MDFDELVEAGVLDEDGNILNPNSLNIATLASGSYSWQDDLPPQVQATLQEQAYLYRFAAQAANGSSNDFIFSDNNSAYREFVDTFGYPPDANVDLTNYTPANNTSGNGLGPGIAPGELNDVINSIAGGMLNPGNTGVGNIDIGNLANGNTGGGNTGGGNTGGGNTGGGNTGGGNGNGDGTGNTDGDAQSTSTGLTADAITAEYQRLFGRAPDQEGLDYWVNKVESGNIAIENLGSALLNGASAGDRYTYNSNLINSAYQDLFGREADPEGFNYWMNALGNGNVTASNLNDALLAGATQQDTAAYQGSHSATGISSTLGGDTGQAGYTVAGNSGAAPSFMGGYGGGGGGYSNNPEITIPDPIPTSSATPYADAYVRAATRAQEPSQINSMFSNYIG